MRLFRGNDLSNKVLEIKNLISNNLYDSDLLDDDYFYFNILFNDDQIPIIGDGSDSNHMHIMLSSKALMSNIESVVFIISMALTRLPQMVFL